MYRNRVTLTLLVIATLTLPWSANASTYRNLCMSAPGYCTPTGTQVSRLDANVCLSKAGGITLKGTAPCPSNAWAYYVEHGEVVDPTGRVEAYLPLDNACGQAGLCVDGPAPDGSQEFGMCCYVDEDGEWVCVPGVLCGGTLWYCYDGVSNSDGTVTCFEAEQA
jgi:hypothetical protein